MPRRSDTVGAFLVKNGSVLLGRRAPHKSFAHQWDAIGGHLQAGEYPWAGLRRELREELDIDASAGDRIAGIRYAERGDRPVLLTVFLVSCWTGEPTIRNDEHSELRWFLLSEASLLPDLAISEYRELLVNI